MKNRKQSKDGKHKDHKFIAELISECADQMEVGAHEVSWIDLKTFTNLNYPELELTRADILALGGYNTIRDAFFPPPPSESAMVKERIKEHAKVHRRLGSDSIKKQFLLESIEKFSERVFRGRVQPTRPIKQALPTKRVLNLVLSDLHYGADLLIDEVGVSYGKIEEARRTAAIFDQLVRYKEEFRSDTELEILILGDIFQNQLHDMRDGAVLAEQACRAIHLLSQGIAYSAQFFKKVRVRCATGNHGRNKGRHAERATYQKWDSIETIVYYAIKQACSNLANVEFFIPKTQFFVYEVFGKKVYATHGDTALNVGYPGKAIRVEQIEGRVNKLNAALSDTNEYSVIVVGHVHVGSMTQLSNGSTVLTNGALIPPDHFAVSIGIPESVCGQWIFESLPGMPMSDVRFVRVSTQDDSNGKLDQIIRPWPGL